MAARHRIEWARLTPTSVEAKKAFTETYQDLHLQADHEKTRYHLEFFVLDDTNEAASKELPSDTAASELDDSTSEVDFRDRHDDYSELLDGFYRLPLESVAINDLPFSFRLGRGNSRLSHRGVELLFRTVRGAPISYCTLKPHHRSGLIVIRATCDGRVFTIENNSFSAMRNGEERILRNRANSIRLDNDLHFDLQYMISPQQFDAFHPILSKALQKLYGTATEDIMVVSSDETQYRYIGKYQFERRVLANGTFGTVMRGFDKKTGEPVAVKEIMVRDKQDAEILRTEARIGNILKGRNGIVTQLAALCNDDLELDKCDRFVKSPTRPIAEPQFIVSELGKFTISSADFRNLSTPRQLTVFRQALEGIHEMHIMGIIHGDISMGNTLVQTLEPLTAGIFDFGKAVIAKTGTNTAIGPKPTLAPEVMEVAALDHPRKHYDALIDVWAWAVAVCYSSGFPGTRDWINSKDFQFLHTFLDRLQQLRPEYMHLVRLLRDVLVWNPTNRPSAEKALRYPVWDDCSDRVDEKNPSQSGNKVARTIHATDVAVAKAEKEKRDNQGKVLESGKLPQVDEAGSSAGSTEVMASDEWRNELARRT